MKTRRIVAVLLSVFMMIGLLSACGSQSSQPASTPAAEPAASPAEAAASEAESAEAEAEPAEAATPGEVFKFVLGTTYPDPTANPEHNYRAVGLKKFVDLVNERAKGRIEITAYYDSLLGGNPELYEQIRMDELDMFYGEVMSSADPRLGVFKIPYVFTNYEMVEELIAGKDAPLFKIVHDWEQDQNVELISVGISDFRGYLNNKHRVATVSDVRDLKTRIYEDAVVSAFWKNICNAVSMGMSEVYTSIQTGIIDGIDFPAGSITSRALQEVCKYYSDIDWQWSLNCTLYMNSKKYNALPDDLKQLISDCAWEAVDFQADLIREDAEGTYALLEEQGVEIYHLTDEERQTWKDYSATLSEAFKSITGAEAYETVMAVVDEYNAGK